MGYCETNQGIRVKIVLTDDEIGLTALDDLCNKYSDWLKLSQESAGGRKTRSANKKADSIYNEIMAFELPPIKLNLPEPCPANNQSKQSLDSDTSDSRPITRSLRPRCRTPSSKSTFPSTPTNQRLRAHMNQQSSSASSNSSASGSSSNVLVAALNQQHPSVSVTKIRQLLRADSVKKRRDEEEERQQRIRLERKVKEERAEAQKRKLLEDRALTAKKKREQRLVHAAEVRKARELSKKVQHNNKVEVSPEQKPQPIAVQEPPAQVSKPTPPILNETFKTNDVNNIEIVTNDDTNNSKHKETQPVATWARAISLRAALIEQFTNPNKKTKVDPACLLLPVDLEKVLGKAAGAKHLYRTSSAVWTPPRKSMRRSNSIVGTPKRP